MLLMRCENTGNLVATSKFLYMYTYTVSGGTLNPTHSLTVGLHVV